MSSDLELQTESAQQQPTSSIQPNQTDDGCNRDPVESTNEPPIDPIATPTADNPQNAGDNDEAVRTISCVTLNMNGDNAAQNEQQPDGQQQEQQQQQQQPLANDMNGDPEFEVNVKAIVHELLDYNIPTPADGGNVELEQIQQRPWHIRLAHGLVSGLWAVFGKGGSVVRKILSHLHNLLVRNNSWLMVIIFLICAIENVQLVSDPTQFTFLKVVFEVISAFGNVGHSICHPSSPTTSFSGVLSPASKLLIILTLIIGRHRGLLGSMKDQESTEKDVESVVEEHELQQAQRQFQEKSSRFFRRRRPHQKNTKPTTTTTTTNAVDFQTSPAKGAT